MQIKKGYWIVLVVSLLSACVSTSTDHNQAAAARLKLGMAYLAQSKTHPDYLNLAYKNLQSAENHAPNNPYVLFGLAQFYQQVGDKQRADALYQRLIQGKQDEGVFLIYYGRFLCQNAQYKKAQHYFERVATFHNYQWKVDALEQSAYCALFEPNLMQAKAQFKQLFLFAPAKRADALKMISYYETRGNLTEAKNLSVIVK